MQTETCLAPTGTTPEKVCVGCHKPVPTVDGHICADCLIERKIKSDGDVLGKLSGAVESNCRECGHLGLHLGGLCKSCWTVRDQVFVGIDARFKPAHTEADKRLRRWNAVCADICRVPDRAAFNAKFETSWYHPTVWKTVAPWIAHNSRASLSLLLSADTGVGKTFLLGHLFGVLLDRGCDNADWISGPQIWEWARASTPLGGWVVAPWLIIDDLGVEPARTERERAMMTAYLYQIGNARGARATLVSSNLTPTQFETIYGSAVCQRLAPRSLWHTPEKRLFGLKQKSLL